MREARMEQTKWFSSRLLISISQQLNVTKLVTEMKQTLDIADSDISTNLKIGQVWTDSYILISKRHQLEAPLSYGKAAKGLPITQSKVDSAQPTMPGFKCSDQLGQTSQKSSLGEQRFTCTREKLAEQLIHLLLPPAQPNLPLTSELPRTTARACKSYQHAFNPQVSLP